MTPKVKAAIQLAAATVHRSAAFSAFESLLYLYNIKSVIPVGITLLMAKMGLNNTMNPSYVSLNPFLRI